MHYSKIKRTILRKCKRNQQFLSSPYTIGKVHLLYECMYKQTAVPISYCEFSVQFGRTCWWPSDCDVAFLN